MPLTITEAPFDSTTFELDHIKDFERRLHALLNDFTSLARSLAIRDKVVFEAEDTARTLATLITDDDFASPESCDLIRGSVQDISAACAYYGFEELHRETGKMVRLVNRRRNTLYPFPEFAWLYS